MGEMSDMIKLLMAVRKLSFLVYEQRAEIAALRKCLLKASREALSEHQVAEIETFLHEQKETELERMILDVGESDPGLADELGKLLGREDTYG